MLMQKNKQEAKTETAKFFKKCPLCGKEWGDADSFLEDPVLHLNGYQGNFKRLLNGRERGGLLLFTHRAENCGTTLALDPSMVRSR